MLIVRRDSHAGDFKTSMEATPRHIGVVSCAYPV